MKRSCLTSRPGKEAFLCVLLPLLTGKQNSSKAGFTKVMYCDKICSRSLPRSLMSRSTAGGRRKAESGARTWISPPPFPSARFWPATVLFSPQSVFLEAAAHMSEHTQPTSKPSQEPRAG